VAKIQHTRPPPNNCALPLSWLLHACSAPGSRENNAPAHLPAQASRQQLKLACSWLCQLQRHHDTLASSWSRCHISSCKLQAASCYQRVNLLSCKHHRKDTRFSKKGTQLLRLYCGAASAVAHTHAT
jgi:hypothetical protein